MVRHLRFVPAAPEYRSPVQKPQLMELTSTRFVAAMAVLLGHFSDLLALPPLVSQLISGGIGVSFFFVLLPFTFHTNAYLILIIYITLTFR